MSVYTFIHTCLFQIPWGVPYRAFRTVPSEFQIRPSIIPEAGYGVVATTFLPKYTFLGEYEGTPHSHCPYDESKQEDCVHFNHGCDYTFRVIWDCMSIESVTLAYNESDLQIKTCMSYLILDICS